MISTRFRERLLQRAERAGVVVPAAAIDPIEAYYRLLEHWNRKINLTSLPLEAMSDQAIDRTLVEPLVAADAVGMSSVAWFDVGSGGGSPAVPIKIVRARARLTLVEARSRKASFLREVVRELSLTDVEVMSERFEELAARPEVGGTADLVTVRGVRIDEVLFTAVRRLLKSGAELLIFTTIGSRISVAPGFELVRTLPLIPDESEIVVCKAR